MLIETVESDTVLETDICVVGGGAVGLSMARLLAGSGLEITVLEGGGREYDEGSQSLYVGVAEGTVLPMKSAYLTTSRLRHLGGSTGHWEGFCRPLDPIDYEVRDWVRDSGWQISAETLLPFEERAAELVEVAPFTASKEGEDETEADAAPGKAGSRLLPPDAGFEASHIRRSPPTRFAERYAPELEASDSCRLHLNANVVEVVTDEAGARVEHLEVVGGDGQRYRVRARAYVLGAGGIENARLLLASNRHESAGIGNRYDQVGRNYLDHPFLNAGFVVLARRRERVHYLFKSTGQGRSRVRTIVRPADTLQRSERLLNSMIVMNLAEPRDIEERHRDVLGIADDLVSLAYPQWGDRRRRPFFAFAKIATEQAPNPQSRVTLSDEKDALGMPRAHLDWRLTEQDAYSVQRTMVLLAARLGSAFRGRVRLLTSAEDPWPNATGSNHHLGTTRMHEDPKLGVVDTDCRVHGVSNLWIGGSSVFTTSGASNPTFSLLALTVRLADHLKGVLTR